MWKMERSKDDLPSPHTHTFLNFVVLADFLQQVHKYQDEFIKSSPSSDSPFSLCQFPA